MEEISKYVEMLSFRTDRSKQSSDSRTEVEMLELVLFGDNAHKAQVSGLSDISPEMFLTRFKEFGPLVEGGLQHCIKPNYLDKWLQGATGDQLQKFYALDKAITPYVSDWSETSIFNEANLSRFNRAKFKVNKAKNSLSSFILSVTRQINSCLTLCYLGFSISS